MKKLNNKGFAISTMLYGILTMIILILMLLLNIMRSSYNKENNAGDDVRYYLNKCISKQVQLENCYKNYNNSYSCSEEYDTYTKCMGNETVSGIYGDKSALLSRLLTDKAESDNTTGLAVDPTNTNGMRYTFTGKTPKNYIKIGDKSGRIISIEPNGTIKIILDNPVSSAFDVSGTTADSGTKKWTSSILYNTLETSYNNMEYTSKTTKGRFYTGTIYTSYTTKEAIDTIKSEYIDDDFGILSLEDVLKAADHENCDLTKSTLLIDDINSCRVNNWISEGKTSCQWTLTGYNGTTSMTTFTSTAVSSAPTTTTCQTNMVLYLKAGINVNSDANGTASNPYIIS